MTDRNASITRLNSLPIPSRKKRVRTRNHGRPSSTLPLTPLPADVAAKTSGWVVTPSGRVVRPIKMRPERPLGPILSMASESKNPKKTTRKAKRKPPLVRARRQTIDPTKWGSTYLTGAFVDATVSSFSVVQDVRGNATPEQEKPTDDDEMVVVRQEAGGPTVVVNGQNDFRQESKQDEVLDSGRERASSPLVEQGEQAQVSEVMDIQMADADGLLQISTTSLPTTKLQDLFVPRDGQGKYQSLSLYIIV